jgi:hypothetical protein
MISAAGRTLHDLNYVDLFGEDYAECVELRIRCLWPARSDSGVSPRPTCGGGALAFEQLQYALRRRRIRRGRRYRRSGLELVSGAPGHLLQRQSVAIGVGQPCVLDSSAHILHGADLNAAAGQLSAGLLDVRHH